MFFRRKQPSQPQIQLCKVDGKYFIEQIIHVEVLDENVVAGMRIFKLKRVGSKHVRQFGCWSKKALQENKPVKGIILKNDFSKG